MSKRGAVWLLLALAALAAGCQTAPPAMPARLPPALEPLFQSCAPGDGAAALQVFREGALLGAAEAEWVAKANGDWDVEVSSAIGLTILSLSRRGGAVSASGPLAAKMPPLGVDGNGFLEVDGHLVGIKAGEVPCLLGFKFPRGWLLSALAGDGVSGGGQRAVAHFADGTRDMTVDAGLAGNRLATAACAALSWRKILIFRQELLWCAHLTGRREGTLSGLKDYSLKWVNLDER